MANHLTTVLEHAVHCPALLPWHGYMKEAQYGWNYSKENKFPLCFQGLTFVFECIVMILDCIHPSSSIHEDIAYWKYYIMVGVYLGHIRRRSDYIMGFVTPVNGPNKSKKPTRLIASAHNIRGKV